MITITTYTFILICYFVVGALTADATEDDSHFILWPLVIVKATIKGLFKLLFTGWGD